MRIDSFSSRVPCSCDGGPAAPQRFAEIREAVRAQRPDRVTLSGASPSGAAPSDGAPPTPIVAAPNAASGEPTDPEAAGRAGSPLGRLVAKYGVLGAAPDRPRVEAYG
jgi:hypothetical protein